MFSSVPAALRERWCAARRASAGLAAGWVDPALRQQGIGALLLAALEAGATASGHPFVYCGTSTAASLLERSGWSLFETVLHDGQALGIHRKALACHRNLE